MVFVFCVSACSIPAPHVVAARAYRLASKKRSTTSSSASNEFRATEMAQASTCFDCSPVMGGHSGGSGNSSSNNSTTTGVGGSSSAGNAGSGSASSTALTRLAKLLHQSSTISSTNTPTTKSTQQQLQIAPEYIFPNGGEEAPRRLSWER